MTNENLATVFEAYRRLLKIAKSLHRLDETACNYELTKRQINASYRLVDEANNLATNWIKGYEVYHQTDPRGCSLYLVPLGYHNRKDQDYYRDGIAII